MTALDACDALAIAASRLAQRVVEGSTLWTVAPGMDDHARHLAVEYVHPSSVGGAAVAAIAVLGEPDAAIRTLRERTRSGDVIISMGSTESAPITDLSQRAVAWGTDHVHIGWHDFTSPAPVDPRTYLVTLGPDSSAERLLTRSYHLLWELTFICLQNNRLTTRVGERTVASASCSVCADDATTTEVAEILADDKARVRTACGDAVVDTSLIGQVQLNDLLLVHAGIAIRRLELA